MIRVVGFLLFAAAICGVFAGVMAIGFMMEPILP